MVPIGKMLTLKEVKNEVRGSFLISRLQSSLCVVPASPQAEVDESARSSHPESPTTEIVTAMAKKKDGFAQQDVVVDEIPHPDGPFGERPAFSISILDLISELGKWNGHGCELM